MIGTNRKIRYLELNQEIDDSMNSTLVHFKHRIMQKNLRKIWILKLGHKDSKCYRDALQETIGIRAINTLLCSLNPLENINVKINKWRKLLRYPTENVHICQHRKMWYSSCTLVLERCQGGGGLDAVQWSIRTREDSSSMTQWVRALRAYSAL